MNTTVLSALKPSAVAITGFRPTWSEVRPGYQEDGQYRYRVGGEDQRHDPRREVPLMLIDGIQRGGQGGAHDGHRRHIGDQRECDLMGRGEPVDARRAIEVVDAGPVGR